MASRAPNIICAACSKSTTIPRIANCKCIFCPDCIAQILITAFEQDCDALKCSWCFSTVIFIFQPYDPTKQYNREDFENTIPSQHLRLRQRERNSFKDAVKYLGPESATEIVKKAVFRDCNGFEGLADTMEQLTGRGKAMARWSGESAADRNRNNDSSCKPYVPLHLRKDDITEDGITVPKCATRGRFGSWFGGVTPMSFAEAFKGAGASDHTAFEDRGKQTIKRATDQSGSIPMPIRPKLPNQESQSGTIADSWQEVNMSEIEEEEDNEWEIVDAPKKKLVVAR
ncbi:hypothetical protein EJ08DRAFT_476015 [Tothia fuscella]|uniref:RING-type domain-containing protein n=1 Tax=Tothia fuscella TaxID=1048955 RepID=A0A9P4NID0_9PEZI|nr:hypothetical protein EJ08DRAFT_476015 [Tothia fuscella]